MVQRIILSISIFSVINLINYFIPGISYSQTYNWQTYSSLKEIKAIAPIPNSSQIYCATTGGLFVINQTSGQILKVISNVNGLINIDLTCLAFDEVNNKLWIGASDGSICILNTFDETWNYIYDIKNSSETNKSINYFYIYNDLVFVATGYGIQKISATSFNFLDAPYYRLGDLQYKTSINSLTIYDNQLFAGANDGIAYANLSSNLNDPELWTTYSPDSLFDMQTLETYDSKVFAGSKYSLMYFNGTSWQRYPNSTIAASDVKSLKGIENNLYIISNSAIYYSNVNDLSSVTQFPSDCSISLVAKDNSNNPLFGSNSNGIYINISNQYSFIIPNSPFANIFNYLAFDNENNLWCAGSTSNGLYKYDGNNWTNYNTNSFSDMGTNNISTVVTQENFIWGLSFGDGIVLIDKINNKIRNFNPDNSNLPGIPSNADFCVPSGGIIDNNGILWITIYSSNSGYYVYKYIDTTWTPVSIPNISSSSAENSLTEIVVDFYNTKWIVGTNTSYNRLYYYNEEYNVSGYYSASQDFTDVSNILDVIVDKNNEVWIATNNGVFIIDNPSAVLNGSKPSLRPMQVISGNILTPFLENCRVISNDALNNKWIGSEANGVFHFSSDGTNLIEQFNITNSKIIDNKILSINIDNKSGRAFWGTSKGLSSISTDAVEPLVDFDKIIVSPNPFLLPLNTNLKIDGLVEESSIKILSIDGQEVIQFDSPGGRIANWDGKNYKGEYVNSGIYLIVAFNKDGSKVGVGKVAIVRN